MKISTILFFLFISTASFAQQHEFAPVGATWYYDTYLIGNVFVSASQYVSNDTLIAGKTCKWLADESPDVWGFYRDIAVYKDSGRVYWVDPQTEVFHLAYDFNTVPGDTVTVYSSTADYPSTRIPDTLQVVIDDTGSTIVNGFRLKTQIIRTVPAKRIGMYSSAFSGSVIEDVGFFNEGFEQLSLFLPYYETPPIRISSIICYEDNELGLQRYNGFTLSNCDYSVSIPNILSTQEIKVYPNPTSGSLSIGNFNAVANYAIYTLLGKLIDYGNADLGNNTIDVSSLPKGTYYMGVETENQVYFTKFSKL